MFAIHNGTVIPTILIGSKTFTEQQAFNKNTRNLSLTGCETLDAWQPVSTKNKNKTPQRWWRWLFTPHKKRYLASQKRVHDDDAPVVMKKHHEKMASTHVFSYIDGKVLHKRQSENRTQKNQRMTQPWISLYSSLYTRTPNTLQIYEKILVQQSKVYYCT